MSKTHIEPLKALVHKIGGRGKLPRAATRAAPVAWESSTREYHRLLILVRSLNRGGAQRQLVMLACGLRARGWDVSVALFYGGYPWEDELRNAGVRLYDLRKRGRWDVLGFLFRLARLLRTERPTILHGYLSVPNLLAVLLRPLLPGTLIVWGVRASDMDLSRYDWLARFTFFLECRAARFADRVIANSHAGMDYHIAQGYSRRKMLVIPNGIDTERFQFNIEGRRRLRAQWNLAAEVTLVGVVGRLDPVKDHPTFLEAAAALVREKKQCRFVCVGNGPEVYANKLQEHARALGLGDRVIWVNGSDDMAAVYSALDIACSSSRSEGFPNVVVEAMACARPCVVTDVGDSAVIAGDAGSVVPPGDSAALVAALADMIGMPSKERGELGEQARQRIVRCFSINQLLNATERGLLRKPSDAVETT